MRRPGPLLWLRYTFTGSLPAEYAPWVLHDVTVGTWFARFVARLLVMLAIPEALVVVLVPASGATRALTAIATGSCVVLLMSILSSDSVERVAQRAGHPWGTASRLREARAVETQRRQAAAHRERVARRRAA